MDARQRRGEPIRLVMVVVLAALHTDASPVRADAFDEFRIPAHRVTSWDATLGSSGSRVIKNTYDEAQSRALGGTLRSDLFWLSDSDPRRTHASASVYAQGSRTRQQQSGGDPGYSAYDQLTHLRYASEQITGRILHERYSGGVPFMFGIDLLGAASWQQQSDESIEEQRYDPGSWRFYDRAAYRMKLRRWAFSHGIEVTTSFGLGRTRDATPVYETMVLEQRLSESGVLRGPLSPRTRERLAGLLAMSYDYSRARDRSGKDLWQELSRLLGEDPATRESGIDPRSLQRAVEPFIGNSRGYTLPASPILRAVGSGIRILLTGRQGDSIDRVDQDYAREYWRGDTLINSDSDHYSRRLKSNQADAFAGLGAEYHRPLGSSWQVDASTSALTSLRTSNSALEFEFQGEVQRIIADRWLGSISVLHHWLDADRTKGPTGSDTAFWGVRTSLDYYLESRLVLGVSASSQQVWSRGAAEGPTHQYWRSERFDVTLTYRIAGRFAAPGYFPSRIHGGT